MSFRESRAQTRQMCTILLLLRSRPRRDLQHPLQTANGRYMVRLPLIQVGEQTKYRRFCGLVAELHKMFRGVIETSFGLPEAPGLKKGLAELTIRHCQAILVTDRAVCFQCFFELLDGFIGPALARFLESEIRIQNPQRAHIWKLFQDIPRFEIVRTSLRRPAGLSLEVAEVHERLPDGSEIVATGTVLHRGKRLAIATADVMHGDVRVAVLTGTTALTPPGTRA